VYEARPELEAASWRCCRMRVVSLFTGCGGLDLGLQQVVPARAAAARTQTQI
jgi:hypothetical protein